jgi:hypothetical protein
MQIKVKFVRRLYAISHVKLSSIAGQADRALSDVPLASFTR